MTAAVVVLAALGVVAGLVYLLVGALILDTLRWPYGPKHRARRVSRFHDARACRSARSCWHSTGGSAKTPKKKGL